MTVWLVPVTFDLAPPSGLLCCAKFSQDGLWYRVEVKGEGSLSRRLEEVKVVSLQASRETGWTHFSSITVTRKGLLGTASPPFPSCCLIGPFRYVGEFPNCPRVYCLCVCVAQALHTLRAASGVAAYMCVCCPSA